MKADFESVGKRLPYVEPEGYVEDLVERCATRALHSRKATPSSDSSRLPRRIGIAVTSMAAALLAAAIIFPAITKSINPDRVTVETIAQSQTLGDVLSTLSNDELAAIEYYSFDEMPTSDYDDSEE